MPHGQEDLDGAAGLAVVQVPRKKALAASTTHGGDAGGEDREAQAQPEGVAKVGVAQEQSPRHGEGPGPCGGRDTAAAVEAGAGLEAGEGGSGEGAEEGVIPEMRLLDPRRRSMRVGSGKEAFANSKSSSNRAQ